MKYIRIFDLLLSGLLIPLWIRLITKPQEDITWLDIIIIGITSLIILAIFIRAVYEWLSNTGFYYKCQCRRMDALILKTRKKLQRVIAETNDVSIISYAVKRLRESYLPEVCSAVLDELSEKERNADKKRALLIYKE